MPKTTNTSAGRSGAAPALPARARALTAVVMLGMVRGRRRNAITRCGLRDRDREGRGVALHQRRLAGDERGGGRGHRLERDQIVARRGEDLGVGMPALERELDAPAAALERE